MKRINKTLLTLTAACALLLSPACASAEETEPCLTVTGTGIVTASADTASISVIVETVSPEAARAAAENAAISQKVWDAAMAAGAERTAVTTNAYNLWPETDGQDKNAKKSYRVQNSMKITVKDLTRTGKVSDAVLAAGATRIGDVSFTLADEEKWKEQAVTRAVADAKQKAEAIAEGLSCRLAGVRSVTIGETYAVMPRFRVRNMAADAGGAETDLTPGKQEITSHVTIIYEIL